MVKLLMIMHYIALCTPMHCVLCRRLLLALFTLGPVELKPEELHEPALVEAANPE
jgi:hypothetical protein